jgi:hypothetical protein
LGSIKNTNEKVLVLYFYIQTKYRYQKRFQGIRVKFMEVSEGGTPLKQT